MQSFRSILSFVNYELKLTATCLDRSPPALRVIDYLYERSPRRVSDHILERLNQSKEDRIDRISTVYLRDLSGYSHFLLRQHHLVRLANFFKSFQDKELYWITEEQFPKKRVSSFEDFCHFVLGAHPNNLHTSLIPYRFIPVQFTRLSIDTLDLTDEIEIPELSDTTKERLEQYYDDNVLFGQL